jgi:hypothetical protein
MSEEYELVELHGERNRLLQGYSRYGYTPQTALADLIDNSLSAEATRIEIQISEQFDGSNKVFIIDNGRGMDDERLRPALAIGSPAEIQNSRLSKFGFGMKTASLEISPSGFSIATRKKGSTKISAASLLEADQTGTGSPVYRIWPEKSIDKAWVKVLNNHVGETGSGTVVIWEDADLKEADFFKVEKGSAEQTRKRIESRIKSYLGMVFHRWIQGRSADGRAATIVFQGEIVKAWDPLSAEFLDEDQVAEIPEFVVQLQDGEHVPMALKAWVIQKGLAKTVAKDQARKGNKHQGIYLYRMDRIINEPQWFGIQSGARDPLNGLRFSLEMDPRLDDLVHLDVKKSNVDLPDAILKKIRPIVEVYMKSEETRANVSKAEGNKSKTPRDVIERTTQKYTQLDKTSPTVRPERKSATEVLTTNLHGGQRPLQMKELPNSLDSGQTLHLVSAHETKGWLWEPRTGKDMSLQLLVNEDHEFYQKVMLPAGEAAYEGFIWLLLAFSRAELATQYSDFKLQFSHMRRHMAETLEEFSEDLPLPDLTHEDE